MHLGRQLLRREVGRGPAGRQLPLMPQIALQMPGLLLQIPHNARQLSWVLDHQQTVARQVLNGRGRMVMEEGQVEFDAPEMLRLAKVADIFFKV